MYLSHSLRAHITVTVVFLQYHQTPLHHSAMWGHTDIMKILIEKGADVNAKDKVS